MKNFLNKSLRISLLVLLLALHTITTYAYYCEVDGIYYNLSGTEATVTYQSTSYNSYSGDVVIPATISYEGDLYDVISIGASAFRRCEDLTSVSTPSSVTSIGESAFSSCSSLISITIPEKVTKLGSNAFYGCSGLTEIKLSGNVTSVGSSCFEGCTNLTSLILQDSEETLSLTSTNNSPFKDCPLETIYLGRNLSYNSSYPPFKDMTTLQTLTIGDYVTSIGESAFRGCTSLCDLALNGVTSIGDYCFRDCKGLTELTIPSNVASLGKAVFKDCTSLKSLMIDDSDEMLSIYTTSGNVPFQDCPFETIYLGRDIYSNYGNTNCPFNGAQSTLTSLTIGEHVTTIGVCAFRNMVALTELKIPNSVQSIQYAAFQSSGIKELVIPNSVTSVGEKSFMGCSGLTSLSIGNNVTSIGKCAFYSCHQLSGELVLPSSLTSIGSEAFLGCSGFTGELVISSGITSIGNYAFRGCSGFTGELVIPSNVTSIGTYAFQSCIGITSLKIEDGTRSLSMSEGAFDGCHLEYIYLGRDSSSSPLRDFTDLTTLVVGDYVSVLDQSAFYNCPNMTDLTIGSNVTDIGYYAFINCTGLRKVVFKDGTKTLTFMSSTSTTTQFYGCPIEEMFLGRDLSFDSDYAPFKNMTTLTSLTIGNTVTTIAPYSFYGCSGIMGELKIPDSVTEIGAYAFRSCTGLTCATIGNGVTSIGNNSFAYCRGLEDISIGNSVTSIGTCAFYECTNLNYVTIPSSVTSMGHSVFKNCTSLQTLILEDGNEKLEISDLGSLSYSSFSGFPLETLYLGRHLSYDSKYPPFKNITTLSSLTIGSNITSMGSSLFSGCSELMGILSKNPTPPDITSTTFSGVDKEECYLYVPTGSKDVYSQTSYWKEFFNIFEMDFPDGIDNVLVDNDDVQIKGIDGAIVVTGDNVPVYVYSTNGMLLHHEMVRGEEHIALPKGKIYIVKAGTQAIKVKL